jgi:hypothetical protein
VTLQDLRQHLLCIRTRTVTTDGDQRELPPALVYSVVADILRKETA